MATKPAGAVLIKWVGNNSPRFDERIFWQDIQSIVSVNNRDVSGGLPSPADLKPGDTVFVQHIRKHNKPGQRHWKAVVMDKDEAAKAQAVAQLSPSSFLQGSETDAPCQRSSRKRKVTLTEPDVHPSQFIQCFQTADHIIKMLLLSSFCPPTVPPFLMHQ